MTGGMESAPPKCQLAQNPQIMRLTEFIFWSSVVTGIVRCTVDVQQRVPPPFVDILRFAQKITTPSITQTLRTHCSVCTPAAALSHSTSYSGIRWIAAPRNGGRQNAPVPEDPVALLHISDLARRLCTRINLTTLSATATTLGHLPHTSAALANSAQVPLNDCALSRRVQPIAGRIEIDASDTPCPRVHSLASRLV